MARSNTRIEELQPRDYYQMAIGLLAIATAALGVSLWRVDLTPPVIDNFGIGFFYSIRITTAGIAIGSYFGVFLSVGKGLGHSNEIIAYRTVRTAIVWLYFQMVFLTLLFLAGFAVDLIADLNMPSSSIEEGLSK